VLTHVFRSSAFLYVVFDHRWEIFIINSEGITMSIQTSKVRNGAMIAIGAAALILSGCAGTMSKSASSSEMVHCAGVNSCKGQSDCKTAENACKGQNVCKGHGFLGMSATDCTAKHGTII
jgi:hypothetical protein